MAERLRRWTLVLRVSTHFGWMAVPGQGTLIVLWFRRYLKPSVPSEVLSTHFRMYKNAMGYPKSRGVLLGSVDRISKYVTACRTRVDKGDCSLIYSPRCYYYDF